MTKTYTIQGKHVVDDAGNMSVVKIVDVKDGEDATQFIDLAV